MTDPQGGAESSTGVPSTGGWDAYGSGPRGVTASAGPPSTAGDPALPPERPPGTPPPHAAGGSGPGTSELPAEYRTAEPWSDPRTVGSRGPDLRRPVPRTTDPRAIDLRGIDPRGSDPRAIDLRGLDPRGADYPTSAYPMPGPPAGVVASGPPGPPPAPSANGAPHRPGRLTGFLAGTGLGLALLLLVVATVQSVFLVKLSDRADASAAAQQRSEQRAAELREQVENLTSRTRALEERTKGTLNSTAVAKKVLPSVFRVRAQGSTGTAFAFGQVSGGTLLVTNYHVVENAISAGIRTGEIERASESYPVTIVKVDENRDLAVLRAAAKFPRLTPVRAEVQPGEPVVVVGAPLGLTDTVTTGVVSAVRDDVPGLNTRAIQFDAAINPGNSGGPVINAEGQVVGVAQAKIVAEGADGLGLAIPIGEVCDGLVTC